MLPRSSSRNSPKERPIPGAHPVVVVDDCQPAQGPMSGRGADIVRAVAKAYEAGIRLQYAAWEDSSETREAVTCLTRDMAMARPLARRWRLAVVRGGPARVSGLAEAAAARDDMKAAMGFALKAGRVDAASVHELMAVAEKQIGRRMMEVRGLLTAVTLRAAIREWRWLAMLRQWRWRAARSRLYVIEPASRLQTQMLGWVATWNNDVCLVGTCPVPPPGDVWHSFAGASTHSARSNGLASRALTPRDKLRWCGGRRRFDRLKGSAVQEGHEPDRFGFWAVESVLSVRRPVARRGRQLEVLVQFKGLDPVSKAPWPSEWIPISWIKSGELKECARAMEAAALQSAGGDSRGSVKRKWGDLIWEGASEGQLRHSRRLGAATALPALSTTACSSIATQAPSVLVSAVQVFDVAWAVPITASMATDAPVVMARPTSAVWATPISADEARQRLAGSVPDAT